MHGGYFLIACIIAFFLMVVLTAIDSWITRIWHRWKYRKAKNNPDILKPFSVGDYVHRNYHGFPSDEDQLKKLFEQGGPLNGYKGFDDKWDSLSVDPANKYDIKMMAKLDFDVRGDGIPNWMMGLGNYRKGKKVIVSDTDECEPIYDVI